MRRVAKLLESEIDLAPLGLFRILFGLQLFNWLWQLYPNLTPFFTDEGLLPRDSLIAHYPGRFTLLAGFGPWWEVAAFWLLSLAVVVLLTLGWRTRIATILAFVAITSFEWRQPLMLDGSDIVFRLLLFWLIFTPAGDVYSIDAIPRRTRGDAPTGRGPALPVRILQAQVGWIYFASGLEKLGGANWLDGTAIYYALQLKYTYGRAWAEGIATQPLISRLMTWGTLVVELAFLPLTVIPTTITRAAAVIGVAALQVGIALLMNVGNFPVILLSTLVLFLPPALVRRLVDRARIAVVARLSARARRSTTSFVDWCARTSMPSARVQLGARSRMLGAVLLLVTAGLGFATALPDRWPDLRPHGPVLQALDLLSVDQRWNMFSPDPVHFDGWMTGPGRLVDGTAIDLIVGAPFNDDVPRSADPLYSRWVKMTENIASEEFADYRLEYGRMYCRLRNNHLQPGQLKLATFELHYTDRAIQPPGAGAPVLRFLDLWHHQC